LGAERRSERRWIKTEEVEEKGHRRQGEKDEKEVGWENAE